MDQYNANDFAPVSFDSEFESFLDLPPTGLGSGEVPVLRTGETSSISNFGQSGIRNSQCAGCVKYQADLERIDNEHRVNFQFLKKKIINTDQIIRNFRGKQEECERKSQEIQELNRRLDQATRDSEILFQQLKTAMDNVKPLQEEKERLEAELKLKSRQVQELTDSIEGERALMRQRTAQDENNRGLDAVVTKLKKLNSALTTKSHGLESRVKDLICEKKGLVTGKSVAEKRLENMALALHKAQNVCESYWAKLVSHTLMSGEKKPNLVPNGYKSMIRKFVDKSNGVQTVQANGSEDSAGSDDAFGNSDSGDDSDFHNLDTISDVDLDDHDMNLPNLKNGSQQEESKTESSVPSLSPGFNHRASEGGPSPRKQESKTESSVPSLSPGFNHRAREGGPSPRKQAQNGSIISVPVKQVDVSKGSPETSSHSSQKQTADSECSRKLVGKEGGKTVPIVHVSEPVKSKEEACKVSNNKAAVVANNSSGKPALDHRLSDGKKLEGKQSVVPNAANRERQSTQVSRQQVDNSGRKDVRKSTIREKNKADSSKLVSDDDDSLSSLSSLSSDEDTDSSDDDNDEELTAVTDKGALGKDQPFDFDAVFSFADIQELLSPLPDSPDPDPSIPLADDLKQVGETWDDHDCVEDITLTQEASEDCPEQIQDECNSEHTTGTCHLRTATLPHSSLSSCSVLSNTQCPLSSDSDDDDDRPATPDFSCDTKFPENCEPDSSKILPKLSFEGSGHRVASNQSANPLKDSSLEAASASDKKAGIEDAHSSNCSSPAAYDRSHYKGASGVSAEKEIVLTETESSNQETEPRKLPSQSGSSSDDSSNNFPERVSKRARSKSRSLGFSVELDDSSDTPQDSLTASGNTLSARASPESSSQETNPLEPLQNDESHLGAQLSSKALPKAVASTGTLSSSHNSLDGTEAAQTVSSSLFQSQSPSCTGANLAVSLQTFPEPLTQTTSNKELSVDIISEKIQLLPSSAVVQVQSLTLLPAQVKSSPLIPLQVQTSQSLPQVQSSPLSSPQVQSSPLSSPQVQTSQSSPQVQTSPLSSPQVQSSPLSPSQFQTSPLSPPQVQTSPLSSPQVQSSPLSSPQVQSSPLSSPQVQSSPLSPPQVQTSPLSSPQVQSSPLSSPQVQSSPLISPYIEAPSPHSSALAKTAIKAVTNESTATKTLSSIQHPLSTSSPAQLSGHCRPSVQTSAQVDHSQRSLTKLSTSSNCDHDASGMQPLIVSDKKEEHEGQPTVSVEPSIESSKGRTTCNESSTGFSKSEAIWDKNPGDNAAPQSVTKESDLSDIPSSESDSGPSSVDVRKRTNRTRNSPPRLGSNNQQSGTNSSTRQSDQECVQSTRNTIAPCKSQVIARHVNKISDAKLKKTELSNTKCSNDAAITTAHDISLSDLSESSASLSDSTDSMPPQSTNVKQIKRGMRPRMVNKTVNKKERLRTVKKVKQESSHAPGVVDQRKVQMRTVYNDKDSTGKVVPVHLESLKLNLGGSCESVSTELEPRNARTRRVRQQSPADALPLSRAAVLKTGKADDGSPVKPLKCLAEGIRTRRSSLQILSDSSPVKPLSSTRRTSLQILSDSRPVKPPGIVEVRRTRRASLQSLSDSSPVKLVERNKIIADQDTSDDSSPVKPPSRVEVRRTRRASLQSLSDSSPVKPLNKLVERNTRIADQDTSDDSSPVKPPSRVEVRRTRRASLQSLSDSSPVKPLNKTVERNTRIADQDTSDDSSPVKPPSRVEVRRTRRTSLQSLSDSSPAGKRSTRSSSHLSNISSSLLTAEVDKTMRDSKAEHECLSKLGHDEEVGASVKKSDIAQKSSSVNCQQLLTKVSRVIRRTRTRSMLSECSVSSLKEEREDSERLLDISSDNLNHSLEKCNTSSPPSQSVGTYLNKLVPVTEDPVGLSPKVVREKGHLQSDNKTSDLPSEKCTSKPRKGKKLTKKLENETGCGDISLKEHTVCTSGNENTCTRVPEIYVSDSVKSSLDSSRNINHVRALDNNIRPILPQEKGDYHAVTAENVEHCKQASMSVIDSIHKHEDIQKATCVSKATEDSIRTSENVNGYAQISDKMRGVVGASEISDKMRGVVGASEISNKVKDTVHASEISNKVKNTVHASEISNKVKDTVHASEMSNKVKDTVHASEISNKVKDTVHASEISNKVKDAVHASEISNKVKDTVHASEISNKVKDTVHASEISNIVKDTVHASEILDTALQNLHNPIRRLQSGNNAHNECNPVSNPPNVIDISQDSIGKMRNVGKLDKTPKVESTSGQAPVFLKPQNVPHKTKTGRGLGNLSKGDPLVAHRSINSNTPAQQVNRKPGRHKSAMALMKTDQALLSHVFEFFNIPRPLSPLPPSPPPKDRSDDLSLTRFKPLRMQKRVSHAKAEGGATNARVGSMSSQMMDARKILAKRKSDITVKPKPSPDCRGQKRAADSIGVSPAGPSTDGRGQKRAADSIGVSPAGPKKKRRLANIRGFPSAFAAVLHDLGQFLAASPVNVKAAIEVMLTRLEEGNTKGLWELLCLAVMTHLEEVQEEDILGRLVSACQQGQVVDEVFVKEDERRLVQLICAFLKLDQSLDRHSLMALMWTAVFKRPCTNQQARLTYCRVFTSLCLEQGDLEQARLLVYSIAWCDHLDLANPLLAIVGVWPAVLSSSSKSSVRKVLMFMLRDKYKADSCLYPQVCLVMQRVCLIDVDENEESPERLLKSLLQELLHMVQNVANGSKVDNSFESMKAVELLLVHQGQLWAEEHFIRRTLVSFAMKWEKRKLEKNKLPDMFVLCLIRILRAVIAIHPLTSNAVRTMLGTVFPRFIKGQASGDTSLELTCVDVIFELTPLDPENCLEFLHKWQTSSQYNIPPETLSKLQQLESVLSQEKLTTNLANRTPPKRFPKGRRSKKLTQKLEARNEASDLAHRTPPKRFPKGRRSKKLTQKLEARNESSNLANRTPPKRFPKGRRSKKFTSEAGSKK